MHHPYSLTSQEGERNRKHSGSSSQRTPAERPTLEAVEFWAYRMTFAPPNNCNSIELLVIRAFDEMHNAILSYQITCLAERALFGSNGPTDCIAVQSAIQIVRRPSHAQTQAAVSLFELQIYR